MYCGGEKRKKKIRSQEKRRKEKRREGKNLVTRKISKIIYHGREKVNGEGSELQWKTPNLHKPRKKEEVSKTVPH